MLYLMQLIVSILIIFISNWYKSLYLMTVYDHHIMIKHLEQLFTIESRSQIALEII